MESLVSIIIPVYNVVDYLSETLERTKDVPYQTILLDAYRYTNKYKHYVIWGGLYRADLIGSFRFAQDLFVGEDTLLFAQLLKEARQLTFVEEELYYYRYLENSLAHAQYNVRQSTEVTAWERVCEVFSDESDDFCNECFTALAIRCRKNYLKAVGAGFADKQIIRSFYRKCFKYQKNYYKSQEISLSAKIEFAAFLCAPMLYVNLSLARQKRRGY